MKVTVDHNVCELNAVCVSLAGDAFAIGDDDRVQVIQPANAADEQAALAAAAECPTQAITITDR